MKTESSKPQSTDEYIRKLPGGVQRRLSELRSAIRKAAPGAREKISYGVPTFYDDGKNLVHFAAFGRHIGFYPTPGPIVAFRDELKQYGTSKGAIQFPLDESLPLRLITRMVKFRVAEVRGVKPRKARAAKRRAT